MRFLLCGIMEKDCGCISSYLKQTFGAATEIQCAFVEQKGTVQVTVFYSPIEVFVFQDITAQIDTALAAPDNGRQPYYRSHPVRFEGEAMNAYKVGLLW